jgi:SagB-type dehydrogenase family enzyme
MPETPENLLKQLHENSQSYYKNADPLDRDKWPKEWLTTYYKEYPRFSSVVLPESKSKAGLAELTKNRSSHRDFSGEGITLTELADMLQNICGEFTHADGKIHRAQGSAGARHPIEVYPIVRFSASSDLQPGVYHYNVKEHTLEYLWPEDESLTKQGSIVENEWANQAAVVFIMTSVFWRSQNKYSLRSYRFMCMEAGAIMQNAYLYCSDTGLKMVGYGGVYDDRAKSLLQLNTEIESTICSFLVGK